MTADHILTESERKFLEELCLTTWEPLYRFIYFKVQNREEAEDITQETYVKVLQYWQEHNVEGANLPGFINTVAMNIMRDRWRKNQRRGVEANIEEISPRAAANESDQDAIIRRMEVERAMYKLSEDYRRVLDLRIIKGYSVSDTAKMLNKSEAAVRTAQYRALQSLAQIIDLED